MRCNYEIWRKQVFFYGLEPNFVVTALESSNEINLGVSSVAATNDLWFSDTEILLPGALENSRSVYIARFNDGKKSVELCRIMLDYANPFYGLRSEVVDSSAVGNHELPEYRENLSFVGCMFAIPEVRNSNYYHSGPVLGMLTSCEAKHLHDVVYLYSVTKRCILVQINVPGRLLNITTSLRNSFGGFGFVYALTNQHLKENTEECAVEGIRPREQHLKKFIRQTFLKKCVYDRPLYTDHYSDSCQDYEDLVSPPSEVGVFHFEKFDLCKEKANDDETHDAWTCDPFQGRDDWYNHSESRIG